MRVTTDVGALAAATLPGLAAVSMRKATAGALAAGRFSRVDTGAMRAGWHAEPAGAGGARVVSGPSYTIYHEYGTYKMAAKPMARPSMPAALAG